MRIFATPGWRNSSQTYSRQYEDLRGDPSNNWTKGNPCLSADLLGDWREEVVRREPDGEHLRLYATPHPTDHLLPTLLHDPQYRLAVAWQNVAYNQPPHPSFFVGVGTDDPPRADVDLVGSDSDTG